jgi:hypothetical protein
MSGFSDLNTLFHEGFVLTSLSYHLLLRCNLSFISDYLQINFIIVTNVSLFQITESMELEERITCHLQEQQNISGTNRLFPVESICTRTKRTNNWLQNNSCKSYHQKLSLNLLIFKLFYILENKILQNYLYLYHIVTFRIEKL